MSEAEFAVNVITNPAEAAFLRSYLLKCGRSLIETAIFRL